MPLAEDPFQIDRVRQKLYRGAIYYGRRGVAIAAISGIDIALSNIVAKASGKPIHELSQNTIGTRMKVYASI